MGAENETSDIDAIKVPVERVVRKRWVTESWLLKNYVSWSRTTLSRRIENEDFPFFDDVGGRMFDLDKVDLWFQKRKGNVA